MANGRNVENGGLLSDTNGTIQTVEGQLEARQADLDQANAELDVETGRWAGETQVHEDLMASLYKEMEALNSCIEIFMNVELSGSMIDRLD